MLRKSQLNPNILRAPLIFCNKVSVYEDYSESFPNMGRGVLLNRQVDKFTKSFLVCQIHFEVLKHVLHTYRGR